MELVRCLMDCSRIGAVFAFACWSVSAHCEPAVAAASMNPEVPRLTVNMGPFLGLTFGSQCHATGSDTAMCTNIAVIAGARLAPRWRLLGDKLGVGFSTGIAWVSQSRSLSSTSWYDGQLGARYYFGHGGPLQSWIDVTGGAILAVERLATYQNDVGDTVASHSISDWAPAASLAVGYDTEMVHNFGLAPELRVSFFGLNHHVGVLDYGTQTVVTLGLGFVGFGFRH